MYIDLCRIQTNKILSTILLNEISRITKTVHEYNEHIIKKENKKNKT